MFYIVLSSLLSIAAIGAIWIYADLRRRDEAKRRLQKVQADKRKVFQTGLPGTAALDPIMDRKRKPSFGPRR